MQEAPEVQVLICTDGVGFSLYQYVSYSIIPRTSINNCAWLTAP